MDTFNTERVLSIKGIVSGLYPYRVYGTVNQVGGLVIEGRGPISSVGDSALIFPIDGAPDDPRLSD